MNVPASHFFAFTPDTLKDWCADRSMPAFRAKQILQWVYEKGVADPAQMTNLSANDRAMLAEDMTFLTGDTLHHQLATDGTQKLLVQWHDGDSERPAADQANQAATASTAEGLVSLPMLGEPDPTRQTECVMIPTESRKTACISSQVGCPVGCRFCASGLGGLDGNLSAGRIVEQVWRLGRLPEVERISHVVFMGMGEPLANFAAVEHAIRTLAAPWGMGISARRITVSTVGLPKAIERLADRLELPVTLALSLHAPNDTIRRDLIPWAEYTSIDDLLGACDKWFQKTGREITLEYILLRGVNDRPQDATDLAAIAKRIRANVNLIRYNEVDGTPFGRPLDDDVRRFQHILRTKNVNVHIRASRGRDIAAACGQLRHEAANA